MISEQLAPMSVDLCQLKIFSIGAHNVIGTASGLNRRRIHNFGNPARQWAKVSKASNNISGRLSDFFTSARRGG